MSIGIFFFIKAPNIDKHEYMLVLQSELWAIDQEVVRSNPQTAQF